MRRVSATKTLSVVARQGRGLPKGRYVHLLESLHSFIRSLKPYSETYWSDYKNDSSYTEDGAREKEHFVVDFLKARKVGTLLDIGCNTGYYSEKALDAGVGRVIGTDFDCGALNVAARNAVCKKLNLTPIFFDISNPSPAIGWNLRERSPLHKRLPDIDASICLAVIHHVVIGRNIPMSEFVDWLAAIAPAGVVEFVPKDDPMVVGLLSHREDVFPDYREDVFLGMLERTTVVIGVHRIANSGRKLIAFSRK